MTVVGSLRLRVDPRSPSIITVGSTREKRKFVVSLHQQDSETTFLAGGTFSGDGKRVVLNGRKVDKENKRRRGHRCAGILNGIVGLEGGVLKKCWGGVKTKSSI